jgi:hypothetical protein
VNDETVSLPRAIVFGTRIQRKGESPKDLGIRPREFSGVEKGKICLYRREGLILEVGMEGIDQRGRKDRRSRIESKIRRPISIRKLTP